MLFNKLSFLLLAVLILVIAGVSCDEDFSGSNNYNGSSWTPTPTPLPEVDNNIFHHCGGDHFRQSPGGGASGIAWSLDDQWILNWNHDYPDGKISVHDGDSREHIVSIGMSENTPKAYGFSNDSALAAVMYHHTWPYCCGTILVYDVGSWEKISVIKVPTYYYHAMIFCCWADPSPEIDEWRIVVGFSENNYQAPVFDVWSGAMLGHFENVGCH